MATLPVIYSQWSIIYWKGYQRKQEVGAQVWNGVEPILKKKKIQVNLLDLLILTQTILDIGLGQYQPPGQVFCTWWEFKTRLQKCKWVVLVTWSVSRFLQNRNHGSIRVTAFQKQNMGLFSRRHVPSRLR